MKRIGLGGLVALAFLGLIGSACSSENSDSGGTGGVAAGGASANGGANSASVGGSSTSTAGTGTGGSTRITTDVSDALNCTNSDDFGANSIPCNGACLLKPGDESNGCRILMRSYAMTSLVVDPTSVFVSDKENVLPTDPLYTRYNPGSSRIAIWDRVSKAVVGQILPAVGTPHVRAVTSTQVAFVNSYEDPDKYLDTLRVANRTTGDVTDSTLLNSDISLDDSADPVEKVWFQGDTVLFQDYAGWGESLHSVPVTGGTITEYAGYLLDVIDPVTLTVLGFADMFVDGMQLYQMVADADPTPIGDLMTSSCYDYGGVYADSDYVYFLNAYGYDGPLTRATRAGTEVTTLATYPGVENILSAGPDGFLIEYEGLLLLIPLEGGAPKKLADFGAGTYVRHAQISGKQVYVVAESYMMYSSYLLEIDLT